VIRIPLNKPTLLGREFHLIRDAIRRGQLSGDGYYSNRCAGFLGKYLKGPDVLMTSSCTHALELAYLAAALEPGDEVILPSFTFPSTANAFVLRGGVPRFVDIRRDTLNMDEKLLPRSLTRRTKAISPVHYAGVPCEMDVITAFARRHRLYVVEDAAQALGARYHGRPAGSFGDFSAFSFHETKSCICGEGGCVAVRNPRFFERAEMIRQKGTNRQKFFRGEVDKYSWVDVGSSYLMSDLQAAYLYAQLQGLAGILRKRRQLYERYEEALRAYQDQGRLQLPVIPPHVVPGYHLYFIILRSEKDRERIQEGLKRRGILSVIHYFPLHLSRMGRRFGYRHGDFPVTEELAPRLLRLPLYNAMTGAEQHRVITSLKALLSSSTRS
jgi:dTDP-4-amino-4,6-dideoxygalactose transaminase